VVELEFQGKFKENSKDYVSVCKDVRTPYGLVS